MTNCINKVRNAIFTFSEYIFKGVIKFCRKTEEGEKLQKERKEGRLIEEGNGVLR